MDEELLLRFEGLEETHWWFAVRRRLVLEWVARYAPEPVTCVLEVGCGTGGTLKALGEHFSGAEVRGVDPSEAAAAVSRSRACDVALGGFECLPAADRSIDLLLALDVLEHVEDDVAALVETRRVLRPGGRALLTVPALPGLWGPHDVANAHFRRYTRRSIVDAVRNAGLTVERVSYFNALLLPLGLVERTMTRLLKLRWSPGVKQPVRPVNAFLRGVFGLELPLLRHVDLPLGMSLVVVVTRPVHEGA